MTGASYNFWNTLERFCRPCSKDRQFQFVSYLTLLLATLPNVASSSRGTVSFNARNNPFIRVKPSIHHAATVSPPVISAAPDLLRTLKPALPSLAPFLTISNVPNPTTAPFRTSEAAGIVAVAQPISQTLQPAVLATSPFSLASSKPVFSADQPRQTTSEFVSPADRSFHAPSKAAFHQSGHFQRTLPPAVATLAYFLTLISVPVVTPSSSYPLSLEREFPGIDRIKKIGIWAQDFPVTPKPVFLATSPTPINPRPVFAVTPPTSRPVFAMTPRNPRPVFAVTPPTYRPVFAMTPRPRPVFAVTPPTSRPVFAMTPRNPRPVFAVTPPTSRPVFAMTPRNPKSVFPAPRHTPTTPKPVIPKTRPPPVNQRLPLSRSLTLKPPVPANHLIQRTFEPQGFPDVPVFNPNPPVPVAVDRLVTSEVSFPWDESLPAIVSEQPYRTTPSVQKTFQPKISTRRPYPAGTCTTHNCQLPQCRCVGTDIPGSIPLADVPQMVMLTFDDAVNYNNWHYYQGLFPTAERDALRNPNGCRTTATFFLADPNDTVMTMVKTLADKGNEMGSHSQTHSAPAAWSRQDWDIQMQGMRQRVAVATGIPQDKIVGMRAPFLQLGGEEQFSVLQERGFLYDSSMFGGGGNVHNTHTPPLWPFTLHFPPTPSRQVCDQERCPQRSYPRLWEVPITEQFTSTGRACTMTDGCLGHDASVDDVVNFLRHNFNRHYLNNKAPFMISLHATWFDDVPNSYAGLKEFLREISLRRDVWQVTLTQMLDWVRHPVPFSRANEIPSWRCSK